MQINQAESNIQEQVDSDIPFDLDNLVTMEFSFHHLNVAIKYLTQQQKNQKVLIDKLLRDAEPPVSADVDTVDEVDA